MPYPNEHAARLAEVKGFERIARTNHAFGEGVHALYGIKAETSKLISIHFDRWTYTAEEVLQWLSDHDYTAIKWEPAADTKYSDDAEALLFADETGQTGWVEVFKAGKYPQGDLSDDDVSDIAASYSQELQAAPISVDHADKGPAFGWVSKLKAVGGKLYARFRDVVAEFREMAKTAFPRRSVELYPPKASPIKGKWYLKAVSFLGVKAPQVKGLEPLPATFAADDSHVSYAYEEWQPMADKAAEPKPVDPQKFAEMEAKFAETTAKMAELEATNKRLAEANADLAKRAVAETKTRFLAEERQFCEKLSAEGKLVPALAKGLPEALACLREQGELVTPATVKFGEGAEAKDVTLYHYFRDWLGSMTKLVTFGETAGGDPGQAGKTKTAKAFSGEDVIHADLDAQAVAFMEQAEKDGKKVSYRDALLAVAAKA